MQIIKDTSLAWPGDFSVQDAQNIFLQPYKSKAYLFLPHLRLLNNLILVMHLLFSLEMSIYNGTPFTSTAPFKKTKQAWIWGWSHGDHHLHLQKRLSDLILNYKEMGRRTTYQP